MIYKLFIQLLISIILGSNMSYFIDRFKELTDNKSDRSNVSPEQCATCKKVTGSVFTIAGVAFFIMAVSGIK